MDGYDSAEEEDVYEIIPSRDPASRRTLYSAKTRLRDQRTGEQFEFYGLFCSEQLHAGDFIAMYSGEWFHEDATDLTVEQNRYALSISAGLVIVPTLLNGAPDPALFPAAMGNEPMPGRHANAMLVEWTFGRDQITGIPSDVSDTAFYGCGLVACCAIPRDTEIRWDYGANYPRRLYHYERGLPCLNPVQGSIVGPQLPAQYLGGVPFEAVSPLLEPPSVSSEEHSSDPDWEP